MSQPPDARQRRRRIDLAALGLIVAGLAALLYAAFAASPLLGTGVTGACLLAVGIILGTGGS
uniref:hypothetical protein n=1 Tax=Nonomuraea sp. CA-251285 TaxID=3240002 RepID=UPI003F490B8B